MEEGELNISKVVNLLKEGGYIHEEIQKFFDTVRTSTGTEVESVLEDSSPEEQEVNNRAELKRVLEEIAQRLEEIEELPNWHEKTKKAFFRSLGVNQVNNSLKVFLKRMNKLSATEKLIEKLPIKELTFFLTEIFRLYEFSVSPARDELLGNGEEEMNIPTEEMIHLKNVVEKIYNVEFIIPKVFDGEKFNEEMHENYTGPMVCARRVFNLPEEEKKAFEKKYMSDGNEVVDIYSIGYKQDGEIVEKPKVYVRSSRY